MKTTLFTRTFLILLIGLAALAACRDDTTTPVTEATSVADATVADPATIAPTELPDTATPAPAEPTEQPSETPTEAPAEPTETATAAASATPRPSATPRATATSEATATPAASPTADASPTTAASRPPATATAAAPTQPPVPPTVPPNPTLGQNLLPNPSFEEGHHLQNNVAELQVPDGWRVDFQEGATGFGGQAWDVYVRPETRVLSRAFLPEAEHDLYIIDGGQTVKIFKDAGAISVRLMTDVDLQPGTYVLEGNFYADVFESYANGQKFAPSDPNAGETMLFAGATGTGYVANNYMARNQLRHTFTINEPQRLTVGIGVRGRYAIQNNGWFIDNMSLRQLQ